MVPARASAARQEERWLALAGALARHCLHERSIKLVRGAALDRRFLLSLPRSALRESVVSTLRRLADELAAPARFRPTMEANGHDASCLHIGLEGEGERDMHKIYLEFDELSWREQGIVHLAFKWDPGDPARSAVTRYRYRPAATFEQLRGVIASYYPAGGAGVPRRVVQDVVDRAAARVPVADVMLLEVQEDGNPRRSFDLCLYDAAVRLGELTPGPGELSRHFDLPRVRLAELWQALEGEPVGHLSGGTGRDGGEFLTLYFGARVVTGGQP